MTLIDNAFREKAHASIEFRYLFARLVVGGILVFSGISKLTSPASGAAFLSRLGIGMPLSLYAVDFVIFLELFLGICCILGLAVRPVGVSIAGMFAIFAIGILVALYSGITGACGCFGNAVSSEVGLLAVGRNLALAGVAIYISKRQKHRYSLQSAIDKLTSSNSAEDVNS